jgi:hypothetical protein
VKSIIDRLYEYLLKERKTFSSEQILTEFFRVEKAESSIASMIVDPLLKKDSRFKRQKDGSWAVVKLSSVEEMGLEDVPFILFSISRLPVRVDGYRGLFSELDKVASFILYRGGAGEELHDVKRVLLEKDSYIFLPFDSLSLTGLKQLYRAVSPLSLEIKTLSIKNLVSHFYPEKKYKTWQDIIADFSLLSFESANPLSRVKTLQYVFEHILKKASEAGMQNASELIEISNRIKPDINFSRFCFDRDFLRTLPERPGVYMLCNRDGQIIYVGKTNNLHTRINSYFRYTGESPEKRELILNSLYDIKYREVGSDLEALVEEYKLIEENRPPLNSRINVPRRTIEVSDRILILPSSEEGRLMLFFLSNGSPLITHSFHPDSSSSEVIKILTELSRGKGYVFDPLKIIVISYMKRFEEYLHVIEVDRYGSPQDVLHALLSYYEHIQESGGEKSIFL